LTDPVVTPSQPSRRKVEAIIFAVGAAAIAVIATSVIAGFRAEREPPALTLVVVGIALLATRWPVEFRLGSHHVAYMWTEAALVLSLVLVPPPYAVLGVGGGVLLAYLFRGLPSRKIVFNVGQAFVSSAAAYLAGSVITSDFDPGTVRGLVGLGIAGLVYALTCEVLTDVVVSAVQRVPIRAVAFSGMGLDQALTVVILAIALSIAVGTRWSLAAVAVLPVLVVALRQIHASTMRAREHEQAIRDLESATSALSKLDGTEVLDSLVGGVARLCRAELVEVALAEGTLVQGGRDGLDDAADVTGLTAMTSTPLDVGDEHVGEIRLRFAEPVALTEAEQRALRTLAAIGAVAIVNARRHERTAYDAAHDSLTDLPNRRTLLAAADDALLGAHAHVALIVVDLDRFKEVNDTLGHATGDALLCVVADRLRSAVGSDGLVARLGGDEFAVLIAGGLEGLATAVAERVRTVLQRPARIDAGAGAEVAVAVVGSIGVASVPIDQRPIDPVPIASVPIDQRPSVDGLPPVTSTELLRQADVAMYHAKSTSAGTIHYDPATDPTSLQRLLMEPQLRAAFEDPEQLVVLYQPQVDLSTGAPVGAEALVRWNHPVYGLLTPEVVIPAVERAGLDHALTLLVLERALAARARWVEEFGVDVRVAVNLSPRMMLDRSLPDAVREALRRHATEPERLIVEIPETVAVTDLDGVAGVVGALHLTGVQIALDDFGTGGAPLTLLARMPVDEVKLDRSFVAAMTTNATAEAIVRGTVDLSRSLDLRTVAEGVESATVDRALRDLGCDSGQGYHYGRPLVADAAGQVMAEAKKIARSQASAGVIRLATVRRRPRL
jgi:diguanylate cyclase (GGDEF)-like protein